VTSPVWVVGLDSSRSNCLVLAFRRLYSQPPNNDSFVGRVAPLGTRRSSAIIASIASGSQTTFRYFRTSPVVVAPNSHVVRVLHRNLKDRRFWQFWGWHTQGGSTAALYLIRLLPLFWKGRLPQWVGLIFMYTMPQCWIAAYWRGRKQAQTWSNEVLQPTRNTARFLASTVV
jgi:hypothetical protein